VQAVTVSYGPLITDSTTSGSVVPVTQSQVAAQVAGVVASVLHRTGDWVAAGEVVVQIDDAQLRLSVQNAQSALENARINLTVSQQNTTASNPKLTAQLQSAQNAASAAQKNYDSQKALLDLGGISSSALDNSKSQLAQAQANLEAAKAALDQNQQAETQNLAQLKLSVDQASNQLQLAQLNLQNSSIKAPFAGQIAAMNVTPGMYVSANTSAFLLVSVERQISFAQPPADAPNVPLGSTVQFTYAGKSHPVRVLQAPSAPINGIVPMVASVPDGFLPPYGTVGTITYRITVAEGVLVPVSALQTRSNQNFLYSVMAGKAVENPITVLAQAGSSSAVTGIEAGTQVIVNPPPGLLAGSAVQVVAIPEAQTPSARQQASGEAPAGQGGPPERPGQAGNASAGSGQRAQGQGGRGQGQP